MTAEDTKSLNRVYSVPKSDKVPFIYTDLECFIE